MDPSLNKAATIARSSLYILLGILLLLHAFNIITGSLVQYGIVLIAAYFIVYGIIISGFYEQVLHMVEKFKSLIHKS